VCLNTVRKMKSGMESIALPGVDPSGKVGWWVAEEYEDEEDDYSDYGGFSPFCNLGPAPWDY